MISVGAAKLDITPEVGSEICGFVGRQQPSTGLQDPLFGRAVYIASDQAKLLWIHLDLIGLEKTLTDDLRELIRLMPGLAGVETMISCSGNCAGPCTLYLQRAGLYDQGYVDGLREKVFDLAERALAVAEPCELFSADADVGFKTKDSRWKAVIGANVAPQTNLGKSNREFSSELNGLIAKSLEASLGGDAVAVIANSPCSGTDAPEMDHTRLASKAAEQAQAFAQRLAGSVPATEFRLSKQFVSLTVSAPAWEQFKTRADKVAGSGSVGTWADTFQMATDAWRRKMTLAADASPAEGVLGIELFGVRLGPVVFLGLSADAGADLKEEISTVVSTPFQLVAPANGITGSLPGKGKEGGYELQIQPILDRLPLSANSFDELSAKAAVQISELARDGSDASHS